MFSYYSASRTVMCLWFSQMNKGNLVKVQILIQSIRMATLDAEL